MRICLVTTEYPRATPSGGIGTFTQTLGDLLKFDHEVTLLIASEYIDLNQLQDERLKFVSLSQIPNRIFSGGTSSNYRVSLNIFDWLKNKAFDHIVFPDWQGLAFASIQAKEVGIAFQETKLSIVLHGITAWTKNEEQFPPIGEIDAIKMHYMECYSIEKADLVISPSLYMKAWIRNLGLQTKESISAKVNPITPLNIRVKGLKNNEKVRIVFLGRIEPRKGVELFLRAMYQLENTNHVDLAFLGRALIGYSPIDTKELSERFHSVKHYETLSSREALEMCLGDNTLVVIPSLIENCPYVIQEVASLSLRVLASNVGGIPELISHENLIEPTEEAIRLRVQNFIHDRDSVPRARSLVNFVENSEQWKEIFQIKEVKSNSEKEPHLKIGIVVAHFNQSNFLSAALNSICNQSYSNFEVIVIDDGSNVNHLKSFDEIAEAFSDQRFHFIKQENRDVGFTRNRGVREIDAEIICFLDADDLLFEDAIKSFVLAIQAGADIATSHFSIFLDKSDPRLGDKFLYGSYEPIGPIVNLMWRENVLGGANFAARRSVFQELNGFTEERNSNHQDWQILTRAVLSGKDLRVIPDRLLYYRVLGDSMARSRSHIQGTFEVIDRFTENASLDTLRNLTNGLMKGQVVSTSVDDKVQLVASTQRLAQRLKTLALAIAPYGSLRWKVLLPIYRRIVK